MIETFYTKFGNNKERYYVQDNNAIEQIIKKKGIKLYLETCGPTTAINCMTSIKDDKWITNNFDHIKIQIEDYITVFMNNPNNYEVFKKIRNLDYNNTYLGNEIPQLYPYTIQSLFSDVKVEFKYGKLTFDEIKNYIVNNQSLQICMIDPGHFISVVGINIDTDNRDNDSLIVNDPWSKHYAEGGFNYIFSKVAYDKNVNPWYITYQ